MLYMRKHVLTKKLKNVDHLKTKQSDPKLRLLSYTTADFMQLAIRCKIWPAKCLN